MPFALAARAGTAAALKPRPAPRSTRSSAARAHAAPNDEPAAAASSDRDAAARAPARFPRVALAGLAALSLAIAIPEPARAEDVFNAREQRKAELLAAARAKAAAQASAEPVVSAAATDPEPSKFLPADEFKEQDVRMNGVRETGADETYAAATFDPDATPATAPEVDATPPPPAPEPEPEEPANVETGGGLFGMFAK
jgi:hypothetical protein